MLLYIDNAEIFHRVPRESLVTSIDWLFYLPLPLSSVRTEILLHARFAAYSTCSVNVEGMDG